MVNRSIQTEFILEMLSNRSNLVIWRDLALIQSITYTFEEGQSFHLEVVRVILFYKIVKKKPTKRSKTLENPY